MSKENIPGQGKNLAIITYLTFIGMLIAYFINRDVRSDFATYHIKMMFGLLLLLIVSQVTQAYIDLLAGEILWLISFVLWLVFLISAVLGKKPHIPILSDKFQAWFTFLE